MQDELQAMRRVASAIEPLDASARERVLGWVVGALGIRDLTRTGHGLVADKGAASADPIVNSATSDSRPTQCTNVIDEWLFDEQDYSSVPRIK